MNSEDMERKEEVVEPVKAGSGNDNVRQPASRQQSRSNVKLLKRSHAIKESTSPPPDIYDVNTNHDDMSTSSPEVVNNNYMNKNDRPVTPENNMDSNCTGCIPKGSHGDQASVQTGGGLEKFISNFLHKSTRDKQFLLKIESDMTELIMDDKKTSISFGIMTSYERMLVHRVAEYFGMEHNVDSSGNVVIVTKSKNTHMPPTTFKQLMRDDSPLTEPRKSILKRDSASFEDTATFKSSDKHGGEALRRSKSYEEREEEYEKARKRIFHQGKDSQDGTRRWVEHSWPPEREDLLNTQNQQNGMNGEENFPNRSLPVEQQSLSHLRPPRLMKGESYETKDTLKANSLRSSISKSYSFGGYDQNANARVLTKQDSTSSMSSRVSPLSSGYKSQSLRSDTISATPSPSVTPHFTITVPSQNGAASEEEQPTVLWAVTKIESVPVGSVLINPQTGEPYTNEDGSIYRFDPTNMPNLEGNASRPKPYRLETQPEINEARAECGGEPRQMPQPSHPQGPPPEQPFTFRPEGHQQYLIVPVNGTSCLIMLLLQRLINNHHRNCQNPFHHPCEGHRNAWLHETPPTSPFPHDSPFESPERGNCAPQETQSGTGRDSESQSHEGSGADMCGYMMGLNLSERGRSEHVRRHQTYCPSSHLQVPQNVVNPMGAAIMPRTNDWPATLYRIVYNTGGVSIPIMFNTPPPPVAQPPPFPYRYGQHIVPTTHSGPELNFPPPQAFYQYPPNMQVVAPTPSFFPTMATARVPTSGMMSYVPMSSAPSPIFHQHLPLPATPHNPQNSTTHFPVYTNHAPPVQSFPQYQASSLPRPPVVRGSRMQQGPWS